MTVRGRLPFLALVAIGVIMGAVLGRLIFRAWDVERSALQPYKSGFLAWASADSESGDGVVSINYISQPTIIKGESRFTYWTGGLSKGKRPMSPPTRGPATASLTSAH